MADEERTTSGALELYRQLAEAPYKYDFFQAVRRVECANRDKPRFGHGLRPSEEPIRLGQEPSLAFAPATLARFGQRHHQAAPWLLVHFFGALGPNGPLPLHLTEYARQRLYNHGDATFKRFLDMFNHRMLALFYRAWASSRPTVQYDRNDADKFGNHLAALFGMGLSSLRDRDDLPDRAKLYYAGRFACQTKHAEGLRAVISDYFRMPATIEEFVGEWLTIPPECGWKLGGPQMQKGMPPMGMLGSTALLGPRVWSRQHKFRVVLGPLRHDQFRRMLPGSDSLRRFVALVRNYVGDSLHWDLRLTLLKEAVKPTKLGVEGQLGRTSWILGDPKLTTWEDFVFDPQDSSRQESNDVPSNLGVTPKEQGAEGGRAYV